jgi:hypothetical protein
MIKCEVAEKRTNFLTYLTRVDPSKYETYQGTQGNRVCARIETHVVHWFSAALHPNAAAYKKKP